MQAEIAEIKKLNLELAQQIQAHKQASTLSELGIQLSKSNEKKDESEEESKNSIHDRVNSKIWVSHREKSQKRRHIPGKEIQKPDIIGPERELSP